MLIYRKHERKEDTRECFAAIRSLQRRLEVAAPLQHDQVVELLIRFGEFESAATDILHPCVDTDDATTRALRRASVMIGHIFYNSWYGRGEASKFWLERFSSTFEGLSCIVTALPETLSIRTPEGYAYYGLYPEKYLEAAKKFLSEFGRTRVICIGLRSIGTSLSSVVSATLEELGSEADSYTVRPREHRRDRRLSLSARLEEEFRACASCHFLVIDEGPGPSGSSLSGTAQKLSELGIPDERIVLLPTWESDGSQFVSESARNRWQKHRRFTASFEDLWVASGRLGANLTSSPLIDISAGRWRHLLYESQSQYPAINPHHERRKYLCVPDGFSKHSKSIISQELAVLNAAEELSAPINMLKFSGLGYYGRNKLSRAESLSEAGFCPPPLGLDNGFLLTQFIPGKPLSTSDVSTNLLHTVARYLAWIRKEFPASEGTSYDELYEMVYTNVSLGLENEWLAKLEGLEAYRPMVNNARVVAIDGRMLPHEWLRTACGYLKADAVDHHADHFFPKCQDVAWDIAGTNFEFALSGNTLNYLIETYKSLTKDTDLHKRLPFYSIAYLAYRLAYTSLSARDPASSNDRERFKSVAGNYASLLKRELSRLSNH